MDAAEHARVVAPPRRVLGLLYFVVIKVLRELERSDLKSEAQDRAEIKRREKAAREAHRE